MQRLRARYRPGYDRSALAMRAPTLAAVAVATMAIALPTSAYAAPGDLDPTWDNDGIRVDSGFSGNDVAIQSDGKVVVGSRFGAGLTRYTASGTPDTSFGGGDGFQETNQPVDAIAIQSDGKIVAVGSVGFGTDFWVARYNPNGSPDTSFDGDGEAITDIGTGTSDGALGVVIQSGGRILAVGSSDGDFALARYTSTGAPDNSFDSDGKQVSDLGAGSEFAADVVVQSSGRIVVAGGSGGDFALAGYTDAGALDSSFGAGGLRTTDFGGFEAANSLALMSDGRIVALGHRDSDVFALARYDVNGTLDPSCSGDGKLEEAFAAGFNDGRDVAVQFNDRIVAVGVQGSNFAIARYEPADCALDTTFGGGDGKVITPFAQGNGAEAVAIQPSDGKIVVSGSIAGEPGDQLVARYEGDEPPPPPEEPPPPPPEEPPPPDPCANDRTGPTLTIRSLQDATLYQQGESPASVRIEASDPSGLASDPSDPSREISTQQTGLFTVTVTARDNCNNSTTRTFRYRVAGDPQIGIGGVRATCTSSNFIATIRIESDVSLRTVTARLNGRLLAKGTKSRLSFKVPAKRLRAGMHRITIATRDRAGNRSTMTVNFARCVVVEPTFTG